MKNRNLFILIVCLISSATVNAQNDSLTISEEIEILKEEIRKIRLETALQPIEMTSFSGLGPAASKVYFSNKGLSVAGYGEVVYENYLHNTKSDRGDVLRFVPYFGYKFSDKIVMNTEVEIEHAGIKDVSKKNPEVYVEFLYLDFMIHKNFNLRSGLVLLPVSMSNEFHEPTVYLGTLRADVDRIIIPTVWRDLGIMVYGNIAGGFNYKATVTNGMRTDIIGDWIGGGRQRGAEVNFDKLAGCFRIDYEGLNGLTSGISAYRGEGSEKNGGAAIDPAKLHQEAGFTLLSADAKFRKKNLAIKATYVVGTATGDSLYEIAGRSKGVEGYYAEGGYNVWPLLVPGESNVSLSPFVRYEEYNIHKQVFKGTPDLSKKRTAITFGVDFKPHPQVVIKADYQSRETSSPLAQGKGNNLDEWKIDQFNLSAGFIF